MSKDIGKPYKISLKIQFPTKRHAEIAYDVLRIDEEPKRSFINKSLQLDNNNLIVLFSGELAKHLRVGVSSFFESLILCCDTIKEFGSSAVALTDLDTKYSHYNDDN